MTPERIKVWDLAVRLNHWLMVLLLIGMWWTGEQGYLIIHQWCGFTLLALLVFRIAWGIVGSRYARFSNFLYSPSTLIQYTRSVLSGQARHYPGHNPLGGLAVVALLVLMAAMIVTGSFSTDDLLFDGPFVHLIDYDRVDSFTGWHHRLFNLLLAMIGLHLAAIAAHQLLAKESLLKAMVTGYKPMLGESVSEHPVRMLLVFLLSVAISQAVIWLWGQPVLPY
jgi:cytochrome b